MALWLAGFRAGKDEAPQGEGDVVIDNSGEAKWISWLLTLIMREQWRELLRFVGWRQT